MQVTVNDSNGKVIGLLNLSPKDFSTGSRGYHVAGKIDDGNGKKYQANFMLVEIGSKPKDGAINEITAKKRK